MSTMRCPFCAGHDTRIIDATEYMGLGCAVYCNTCKARGPVYFYPEESSYDDDKVKANELWNIRKGNTHESTI